MLPSLLQVLKDVFPSVKQASVEHAVETLTEEGYDSDQLYNPQPLSQISQGDILLDVPFERRVGLDEHQRQTLPTLVLSNTCDIEQDLYFVVAVGVPFDEYTLGTQGQLRQNKIHNLLYLPSVPELGDYVFDLNICNSLPTDVTLDEDLAVRFDRAASLSWLGHVYLLLKITVHYLRPESDEVQRYEPLTPDYLQDR